MKTLAVFFFAFILVPIIDYIWLARIMQGFYLRELGEIARTEGGVFKPQILPAVGVYILLALSVITLVLPLAQQDISRAAFYGALVGLIVYGVYDLTNLAVLNNYSIKITVVDILWGTFLCSVVSAASQWLALRLA